MDLIHKTLKAKGLCKIVLLRHFEAFNQICLVRFSVGVLQTPLLYYYAKDKLCTYRIKGDHLLSVFGIYTYFNIRKSTFWGHNSTYYENNSLKICAFRRFSFFPILFDIRHKLFVNYMYINGLCFRDMDFIRHKPDIHPT